MGSKKTLDLKSRLLTYGLLLATLLGFALPLRAQQAGPAEPATVFEKINEANRLMGEQPARALQLLQAALAQSFDEKNQRGEAYCYNSLGALNYSLGRYELAIENYQKAIGLFEKLKEPEGLYNSEKYLAIAYEGKGSLGEAERRYLKLLEKARRRKLIDDQIDIHRRLTRIYQLQQEDAKARLQLSRITQLEQQRGNEQGLIDNLNTQGAYYVQQQDSSKAEQYYQDAVELAEQKGSPNQVAQSYENLSNLYRGKRDVGREIQTRQRAIQSNRKRKNTAGEVTNNLEIGKLYLDQGNATAAIPYLKATIDLSEELGVLEGSPAADSLVPQERARPIASVERPSVFSPAPSLPDSIRPLPKPAASKQETQTQLKAEAYESLAKAYEQQGALKEALTNYKEAARLADSLARLRDRALREALDVSRQLSERDEQIRALQQEQELRDAELKAKSRWLVGLAVGLGRIAHCRIDDPEKLPGQTKSQ
jgi:tetratricopeptide (TPR) repeat protein